MAEPMWLDSEAARANCAGSPSALLHLCLDGEPPERCDEHPGGCPPLVTLRNGVVLRKFPARYLTPRHHALAQWARHLARGRSIRSDPFLCWPAPMAAALDLLDSLRGSEG